MLTVHALTGIDKFSQFCPQPSCHLIGDRPGLFQGCAACFGLQGYRVHDIPFHVLHFIRPSLDREIDNHLRLSGRHGYMPRLLCGELTFLLHVRSPFFIDLRASQMHLLGFDVCFRNLGVQECLRNPLGHSDIFLKSSALSDSKIAISNFEHRYLGICRRRFIGRHGNRLVLSIYLNILGKQRSGDGDDGDCE